MQNLELKDAIAAAKPTCKLDPANWQLYWIGLQLELLIALVESKRNEDLQQLEAGEQPKSK